MYYIIIFNAQTIFNFLVITYNLKHVIQIFYTLFVIITKLITLNLFFPIEKCMLVQIWPFNNILAVIKKKKKKKESLHASSASHFTF